MFEQIKRIKMVDKFIIIILTILVINSAVSIFFVDDGTKQTAVKIDLVLRTTLSSIVGYVLSSNFISNKVPTINKCEEIVDEELKKKERNIQLMIIGTVAIVSIITLLIARHFCYDRNLNGLNIALLTDICVGCIGFLIGYTD